MGRASIARDRARRGPRTAHGSTVRRATDRDRARGRASKVTEVLRRRRQCHHQCITHAFWRGRGRRRARRRRARREARSISISISIDRSIDVDRGDDDGRGARCWCTRVCGVCVDVSTRRAVDDDDDERGFVECASMADLTATVRWRRRRRA